jgi:hypothetical protein
VGGAVVVDQVRVVDGDVGGPAVEVVDRVAPLPHDLHHEDVGLGDALGRRVDEVLLDAHPLLGVPGAAVGAERADVQLLPSLLALAELGLGLTPAVGAFDRALVLGTKVVLQLTGALPAGEVEPNRQENQSRDDDRDHHNNCRAVHFQTPIV